MSQSGRYFLSACLTQAGGAAPIEVSPSSALDSSCKASPSETISVEEQKHPETQQLSHEALFSGFLFSTCSDACRAEMIK